MGRDRPPLAAAAHVPQVGSCGRRQEGEEARLRCALWKFEGGAGRGGQPGASTRAKTAAVHQVAAARNQREAHPAQHSTASRQPTGGAALGAAAPSPPAAPHPQPPPPLPPFQARTCEPPVNQPAQEVAHLLGVAQRVRRCSGLGLRRHQDADPQLPLRQNCAAAASSGGGDGGDGGGPQSSTAVAMHAATWQPAGRPAPPLPTPTPRTSLHLPAGSPLLPPPPPPLLLAEALHPSRAAAPPASTQDCKEIWQAGVSTTRA